MLEIHLNLNSLSNPSIFSFQNNIADWLIKFCFTAHFLLLIDP